MKLGCDKETKVSPIASSRLPCKEGMWLDKAYDPSSVLCVCKGLLRFVTKLFRNSTVSFRCRTDRSGSTRTAKVFYGFLHYFTTWYGKLRSTNVKYGCKQYKIYICVMPYCRNWLVCGQPWCLIYSKTWKVTHECVTKTLRKLVIPVSSVILTS